MPRSRTPQAVGLHWQFESAEEKFSISMAIGPRKSLPALGDCTNLIDMATELSPQTEQYLASIVAGGLFPSKAAALEAAVEALRAKYELNASVPPEHMEPRELPFTVVSQGINPKQAPGISSMHPGCVIAGFADGHTQTIQENISQQPLQALCTKAGGAKVPDDF